MHPSKSAFFTEAYKNAARKPYGYLLVDLNATTPEQYRLHSGLFPPDRPEAIPPPPKMPTSYKKVIVSSELPHSAKDHP